MFMDGKIQYCKKVDFSATLIYKFIVIKILAGFLIEVDKLIVKFYGNTETPRIVKKNKIERLPPSDFMTL